ncbi:hypothetical protein BT96DRAFT_616666 [Gymnopus androsaceus JB14]|uniref:Mid2 domain-containing protein n=1 Tax=Gymnopus androsaceus JB14 TaxID=1447944 RepID=A0A6A4HSY4_9AGAR|nr:hypothetical protein BT96DRAFT_616666 [Gymnopus androsaceus JB14]
MAPTGVGVQVFGTVGSIDGSPTSTYQIDNSVPSTFTFNANGMDNFHVALYSSPALDPGNHTLIMTSIGNDTTEIFLDYIVYNPTLSSSSTSSSISTSAVPTSSTSSLISTSALPSSDPTTTPIPPTSSGHAASSSVGAIAGGVVGSVAGLVFGVFLMYILMRRRNRRLEKMPEPMLELEANYNVIEPHYTTSALASTQLVPNSKNPGTMANSNSLVMADTSRECASGRLRETSIIGNDQLGSTEEGKLPFAEHPTSSQLVSISAVPSQDHDMQPIVPPEEIHHTDAGVSLDGGPGLVVIDSSIEFPPAYASWAQY